MSNVNITTFTIVVILFVIVTGVGFAAARWRRAENMMHLDEWGLGGRGFGTFITWFLLGGDLYTAYTFIAVPALVFGSGSIGFFAVAYTIMVFPVVFIFLPRLWSVCRAHGYVTPADFIRGRYGSRGLALASAFTGILALMPYIALQLVGIQAVLTVMGVGTSSDNTFVKDLPLFVAFLVLAIFTYVSGLRAPALIAFVKDTLIYLFVIVAVFYIPTRLGGWGHIFGVAQAHYASVNPLTNKPFGTFIPTSGSVGSTRFDFASLALGSAVALFLYPHAITGTLAAKRRSVVKRNMIYLPMYSVLLALIALFGYMAIADQTTAANIKKAGNAQLAVPYLFQHMFPSWFTGIAFAGIIIGALVPAAIMAIAAANLFTRNIYVEFLRKDASHADQARISKLASLVVKFGALAFILGIDPQFSIDLQLIGGVIILQTLPSVALGLYTRRFHKLGLIAGWTAGMVAGLWMLYTVPNPATHHAHFGGSAFNLSNIGGPNVTIYAGFVAVLVNLAVVFIATAIARAAKIPDGTDATAANDYPVDR